MSSKHQKYVDNTFRKDHVTLQLFYCTRDQKDTSTKPEFSDNKVGFLQEVPLMLTNIYFFLFKR